MLATGAEYATAAPRNVETSDSNVAFILTIAIYRHFTPGATCRDTMINKRYVIKAADIEARQSNIVITGAADILSKRKLAALRRHYASVGFVKLVADANRPTTVKAGVEAWRRAHERRCRMKWR